MHECILTRCTTELQDADLLELFDIAGVDVSDEDIGDFGEKEYILDRIMKELNVQFNTRKQSLLKTLYAYRIVIGSYKAVVYVNLFAVVHIDSVGVVSVITDKLNVFDIYALASYGTDVVNQGISDGNALDGDVFAIIKLYGVPSYGISYLMRVSYSVCFVENFLFVF